MQHEIFFQLKIRYLFPRKFLIKKVFQSLIQFPLFIVITNNKHTQTHVYLCVKFMEKFVNYFSFVISYDIFYHIYMDAGQHAYLAFYEFVSLDVRIH